MEILAISTSESESRNQRDRQLYSLERNQRDILFFLKKLCSYRNEPQTYDQYERLNDLKGWAYNLRDNNAEIADALRYQPNSGEGSKLLVQKHMRNFEGFSKAVAAYLSDKKARETAHN